MSTTKVKLDGELAEKARKYAEATGYSSLEEFVTHCIEKELARLEQPDSPEEIRKKLQGLGYI